MNSETSIAALFASIRPRYSELMGKTALVTGSGRGIGQGIAVRLGREGMNVVVTSNVTEEVVATAGALQALGVRALPVTADLGQPAEIDRLFEQVQAVLGGVSLLVNNAADLHRGRLLEFSQDDFDNQIDVNIRGAYRCSLRAAETMRAVGGGSLIHISSVGGLRAHWRGLPYDMTKGALDAMTRAMALDLAEYGIRVNGVAPGFIPRSKSLSARQEDFRSKAIPRIPLHRAGTPLDIAAAVAFLASDDASYITGQILYVDGGITAQLSPREAEL
jgi:NAD(P)-dependent dehydrogenase (short-subunit alcohol dehydrogenase family)